MLAVPETVGSNYMGRSDIGSPSGLSVVRLFALCLCRGMAHSRARNTVIQQYDDDIQSMTRSQYKTKRARPQKVW